MIEYMKEILDKFLHAVVSVFPASPFAPVIEDIGGLPFLPYLNWTLPIGDMIAVGLLWLGAIGAYYLYMVIARWVKLLGD